jgi:Cys-tRNA(Pro) deacylase
VSDRETPATTAARTAGVPFEVVEMPRPPTSAEDSAAMQGIALEALLRTIVVRRAADDYLFVLVPGGRQIDWPKLRGHLGVRKLSLPDQEEAREATGYERGAITPFGSARRWPVVADASIDPRSVVAIGGGRRGVNLHLRAEDLFAAVGADVADVAGPASA